MAQNLAASQGTKRRYSGFASPQALHAEESESRRRPNPPLGPMTSLQPPQVGVAVVTIDMFREYQSQVLVEFERQGNQIALLKERTQDIEARIRSLENAEDMAIDAVREIRDSVVPRVKQHQDDLNALSIVVARHNAHLESIGSPGQEFRAIQARDAARPNQLSWRPGPLGNASDQTKSVAEDFKAQFAKSFASLAEHEKHLGENDTYLERHNRHLSDHDRRLGGYDTRIAALERRLEEQITHLLGQDRRFAEHNARLTAQEGHIRNHDMCVAKHNERLGTLDKASEKLNGRVTALEQRTDHGLSPAQISAIMQNHQQRLESLEQALQRHIKASEEALAVKPCSPYSRPHSASDQTQTPERQGCPECQSQSIQPSEMSERAQIAGQQPIKKIQREREEADYTSELRRLGEQLEDVESRIGPLEEQIRLIEKDKVAIATESTAANSSASDEDGHYERLRRTDFQRPEDLAALRAGEDTQLLMQLFSENDKCEDACYTVQRACVHMWSYLICRNRNDEKLISDFWNRDEWKNWPAIIELEQSATMPEDKYFPRYFYEIGEIFNRKAVTKYNGRQTTHRSTGYHLAVDVTKPEKSLWLIYRYVEDHSDRLKLKRGITYKQDNFWHPFANVCEFDIAMIYERFEDWKGSDTPVGSFATSKKLVRQTGALIKPTFIEPNLQELKDEIRRNWGISAEEAGE
ncbi:hypothetical protein F4861DRAFT_509739 [Xylaria intraflava]|nr:hypothetical protein F4861DRAFT_509739 [Xylaria intraflava]